MSLELNGSDFVLASFPRSGNTWLRFILANLMSRNKVEITFHNYHQYVPDIHVIKDHSEWHSHAPFPRIIKSHFLPQHEYKNTIYIVRDPRSAILSYWHYEGKPCELEQYIASEDIWPTDWSNHVEQWLDYANFNNVLVVKYETILSNPLKQIQIILDFMGVTNFSCNYIQESIKRSNIENMSKIEKKSGFWRPLIGEKFVRSGEGNSWEGELSQKLLNIIIKRNSKMMEYFKYT